MSVSLHAVAFPLQQDFKWNPIPKNWHKIPWKTLSFQHHYSLKRFLNDVDEKTFFFFLHFTDLLSVHVRSAGNKAYSLKTRGGKIPVYCHMTRNGIGKCGGGGWTLVMKIDGHKVEWNAFWIEKVGEGLRTTHFGSSSPHIFFVCFFQSVRTDFLAAYFFSDFTLQTYA